MKIYSFAPVKTTYAKSLILGSIPGIASLKAYEYYAYPRNQFWEIIGQLYRHDELKSYQEKLKVIKNNELALWDVIKSCYREGSSDSGITDIKVNNFAWMFKASPQIKNIFFNGLKAKEVFTRYVDKSLWQDKNLISLPSTSPAYTITVNEKMKKWTKIRENF